MKGGEYISPLAQLPFLASTAFQEGLALINKRDERHSNELILKMQFLDILTQRVSHLMEAHDSVMKLCIDGVFKDSFLYLQYYQFETIAHDLLDAISVITSDLNIDQVDRQTHAFVVHQSQITDALDLIRALIKSEAGELKLRELAPLTKRQVQICERLYTMESERIVLAWFLNNASKGSVVDLLSCYRTRMGNDNNEIEFF